MSEDMKFQECDEEDAGGIRIGNSPDGRDSKPLNIGELFFRARTQGTWIVFSPFGDLWTSVTAVDGLGIFSEALHNLIKESISNRINRGGSELSKVIPPGQVDELALEVILTMVRNIASGIGPLDRPPRSHH
jgi:hypothetical protein